MTTIIIDREKGLVVSDSRGTQEEENKYICWTPLPKIKTKKVKTVYDDTQKIFTVGKHVITGCGSLTLLKMMVDRIVNEDYHTPKKVYFQCDFDLSKTNVYVSKRVLGRVRTLKYILIPTKIPCTGYYSVKVDKIPQYSSFTVDGSGKQFAMGALYGNGQSAWGAINAAKEFDEGSGGDTQMVYL